VCANAGNHLRDTDDGQKGGRDKLKPQVRRSEFKNPKRSVKNKRWRQKGERGASSAKIGRQRIECD
jgi:hypothetical protein